MNNIITEINYSDKTFKCNGIDYPLYSDEITIEELQNNLNKIKEVFENLNND